MSHRMILGFPLATVITVGLFLLMQSLIQTEFAPQADPIPDHVIDFIRDPIPDEPVIEGTDPPKRPEPKEPPAPPRIDVPNDGPGEEGISTIIFEPLGPPSPGHLGQANRTAMRLVAIPPEYPFRAAEQGIEGWVLLEFDVSPAGTVQNATVIDSEPPGIFDRSALKAIKKWKFKAKMVDGKPVFQYGIQQQITFELEED